MYKTIRRLLGFVRPFWRGMTASVLLSIVTVGSSIGLMVTSAWLISKAGLQPSIADLGLAPVMVRFFGIARAVFRYSERMVSHHVTFKLLAWLRVWFYTALEPLAPARLQQYRSGDLLNRVVTDIETLENIYIRVIAPPLVAVITTIGMALFFGFFDPLIAVVGVAFMIFAGTVLPLMTWWMGQNPGREMVAARAELNATLVDGIQGIADSLAYGYGQQQLADLNQLNDEVTEREFRLARLEGLQTALSVFLVNLAALTVLILAIPRVDGIVLATLTLATIAAFEAITPLSMAAQNLGANVAAGERLFEIVDTQPAVNDAVAESLQPRDTSLSITGLTFAYSPQDAPALRDVSLAIEPGQRVAIVGPSGSGKSTLVNLLLRFWDYEAGTIQLGGHDLKQYSQADIYDQVGVMSQRTHLFNTTIQENIRLARTDAEDDEIIMAAQQAQIHDFITNLPEGYNTDVGEIGAKLSGGERQRVALARVLLRNTPVLVLDEATANLDAVTERELLRAVYAAAADRTLVMITHRLTLLDEVDQIFVLEHGRVVQHGTHAELVEAEGVYRRLWNAQSLMLEV